ncbi:unnamed protein product [Amoebophrya sp. A120]|nr:unnamed protein product [Amoebophrya sp. A120]|eukprot:GSA120T00024842001.1
MSSLSSSVGALVRYVANHKHLLCPRSVKKFFLVSRRGQKS